MSASPYPRTRRGRPASLVLLAAAVSACLLGRSGLVRRIVVEGPSMLPDLSPGDRLVVVRTPVLEVGDVVAFVDPDEPGRVLVKRVSRLHAERIEVLGDNREQSRDSRAFGPIERRSVLGRAVYRYHPSSAAGPIGRVAPIGRA